MINKLYNGSIIPVLKYKWGVKEPVVSNTHIQAKRLVNQRCATENINSKVIMPTKALGSRAANSFTPKTCILAACNQKNKGGFSVNALKFI
jgi:hypothetical protein